RPAAAGHGAHRHRDHVRGDRVPAGPGVPQPGAARRGRGPRRRRGPAGPRRPQAPRIPGRGAGLRRREGPDRGLHRMGGRRAGGLQPGGHRARPRPPGRHGTQGQGPQGLRPRRRRDRRWDRPRERRGDGRRMNVLVPLPFVLPLLGAALTMISRRRETWLRVLAPLTVTAALAAAGGLMAAVARDGVIAVQIGGWTAPLGITLVADRLSALLLVVSIGVLLAI